MRLPFWSKPHRAQWRCGRVTAFPISAPAPAPITPPAMAPPALPPETAEPISAPVPAPTAPPTSVPVCCCCVWQADSETAPTRASAMAIIFFVMFAIPFPRSLRGGAGSGPPGFRTRAEGARPLVVRYADAVAVVVVAPACALALRLRGGGGADHRAGGRADRRARKRPACASARNRGADQRARAAAERAAGEGVRLLRRLAGRHRHSGGERQRKSQHLFHG